MSDDDYEFHAGTWCSAVAWALDSKGPMGQFLGSSQEEAIAWAQEFLRTTARECDLRASGFRIEIGAEHDQYIEFSPSFVAAMNQDEPPSSAEGTPTP